MDEATDYGSLLQSGYKVEQERGNPEVNSYVTGNPFFGFWETRVLILSKTV